MPPASLRRARAPAPPSPSASRCSPNCKTYPRRSQPSPDGTLLSETRVCGESRRAREQLAHKQRQSAQHTPALYRPSRSGTSESRPRAESTADQPSADMYALPSHAPRSQITTQICEREAVSVRPTAAMIFTLRRRQCHLAGSRRETRKPSYWARESIQVVSHICRSCGADFATK